MATIGKKFGQLRQWTGEKIGSTQRTETSEEFKRLEHETELRHECIEKVHDSVSLYLRQLEKTKADRIGSKDKRTPLENLAEAMMHFGNMLYEESNYGQALVKFGETHERISNIQMDYVMRVRDSYANNLQNSLNEMKEYGAIKAKLERRRLDFDAKMNKAHGMKKERTGTEESIRTAQIKYEDSLTDTTNKMIELNSNEDEQLEDLLEFIDAELAYYKSCTDALTNLQQSLADIPRGRRPRTHSTFENTTPTSRSRSVANDQHSDRSASRGPSTVRGRSFSVHSSSENAERQRSIREPSQGRLGGAEKRSLYGSQAGSVYSNSGPSSSAASPAPTRQNSGSFVSSASRTSSVSVTPTKANTEKQCRVLFDFDAEGADELSLRKGEMIIVTKEIDAGWWEGEMADGSGRGGMFPANYVEVVNEPSMPPRPPPAVGGRSMVREPDPFSDAKPSYSPLSQRSPSVPRSFSANAVPTLSSSHNPPRKQSFGARSYHESDSQVASAGVCGQCGCDDYVPNTFRAGQCNQCFHKH
ncbi:hypothetical protein HK097_006094 [Rhizophlyctis rosea]|uniref:BAR-domain-containing protein n=1 Tax=Rhizophlyctis rosea TaxID=64517 RepID=A0AAD5X597_9FUNG|nr:hypothetical protein HK097_006094 [Rhizophlyctis rosea]